MPSRSIQAVTGSKILFFLWLSTTPLCQGATACAATPRMMGTQLVYMGLHLIEKVLVALARFLL